MPEEQDKKCPIPLNTSFLIKQSKKRGALMNVTQYSKYALSIFFIFILYVAYLLLKPFILTILTAVILVYVFSPVYNFVNRKLIANKYLCSLVVLSAVFLLLSVPVVIILHSLSQQGYEQYMVLKETFSDPTLLECTNGNTEFCATYMSFLSDEERSVLQDFLKNSVVNIAQKVMSSSFALLSSLPSKFLDFFVMIFLMFFLFMDGKKLFETVKNFLPMKLEHEEYLINTLKETTDAVVFGQVSIAMLQGVLAWAGFALMGINHALLLGAFITFLGVIPFLGPTLVWVPLALYYASIGLNTGESSLLLKGIIIAAYGGIVLGLVENVLKPKIIGDKAKLHPALVFLGVLGGISLFGFIGFFLGPIILAVLFTLIRIYEKEKLIQMKKRK